MTIDVRFMSGVPISFLAFDLQLVVEGKFIRLSPGGVFDGWGEAGYGYRKYDKYKQINK